MLRRLLIPLNTTVLYLVLLYALAVGLRFEGAFLVSELLRAGMLAAGFLVPHVLLSSLRPVKPRNENLLITFFIVLLLVSVNTKPLMMILLGLITFMLKTLFRFQGRPIFNPAAAGLLAAAPFGVLTTWWGVSFSPRLPIFGMSVAMLLTLPLGLYVVLKYRKLPTVIGVTMAASIGYFLVFRTLPLRFLLEGTFAFFLLIMATEPKTMPVIDTEEWVYAILLGVLLSVLFAVDAYEAYTMGLLLMNGLFTVYKWWQFRAAKAKENGGL